MTTATKTTVDAMAGIVETTEAMVENYRPIPLASLKETTRKKIGAFWNAATKGLVEFEPHVTSVDLLGADFLLPSSGNVKLFYRGNTYSDVFTLQELAESRQVESEEGHFQFEVIASRVEKNLTDKDDGILVNPLTQPIIVMTLPGSDQFIIVSGRHRLCTLLTMCQVVNGYEHFEIPVQQVVAYTASDVARYVRTANGSRSMNTMEKQMVLSAAQGINLSPFREPSELWADARTAKNMSELKKFNRSLWPAMLSGSVVDGQCSVNGLGDIGNSILSNIERHLKAVHKGSEKALLLVDASTGQMFWEAIAVEGIVPWVINHWESEIVSEFTESKTLASGETTYSFNPSRKASAIGKHVAEFWCEKITAKLVERWKVEEATLEAEKAKKKAEKAGDAIDRDIKKIDDTLKMLRDYGNLTPETEANMLAQRASLLEQKKNAQPSGKASQVAEVKADPNTVF